MSVQTAADESKRKAVKHMNGAIDSLAEIVLRRVHGTDIYTDRFKVTLRETLNTLIELRDRIE